MKNNDLPTMPEWMRHRVEATVRNQVNAEPSRKKPFSMKKTAVLLAAALLTGTVAVGAAQLMHFTLQPQGNYGVDVRFAAETAAPEALHDLRMTAEWLPDGMVQDDNSIEYGEHPHEGGISYRFLLMDTSDAPLKQLYVEKYEQLTLNGHEAVRIQKSNTRMPGRITFDQCIYIAYPEYQRILELMIADNVPQEDVTKIVESISLTETDALISASDMYTWSERIAEDTPEEIGDEAPSAPAPILNGIGDTMQLENSVSVRVEAVELLDDLNALSAAPLPEEWQALAGNPLPQNTRTHWQSGNGTDTLDEVTGTETMASKLVYATVVYTNDGAEPIDELLFYGELIRLRSDAGSYSVIESGYPDADGRFHTDSIPALSYMAWFDVQLTDGSQNGKNYIPHLDAGESRTVHMAWLLPESDAENACINLNPTGEWVSENGTHALVKIMP